MKILTHYDPKPIPLRGFDWCAVYDDDGGESYAGYGATEAEAIRNLMDERTDCVIHGLQDGPDCPRC